MAANQQEHFRQEQERNEQEKNETLSHPILHPAAGTHHLHLLPPAAEGKKSGGKRQSSRTRTLLKFTFLSHLSHTWPPFGDFLSRRLLNGAGA